MTGAELKEFAKQFGRNEELCVLLDCSTWTLVKKFNQAQLDRGTVLALARLGCEKAEAEVRQFLPYKRAALRK